MNARIRGTFKGAVTEYGYMEAYSPGQVTAIWEQVVGWVEEGYGFGIYELRNDLSIRRLIEFLLHHERLGKHEEFGWVREKVAELDGRFRSLLQPEKISPDTRRPWWEAHAPRYGCPELVDDFERLYGVTIEER